jgi:hypothetical protein
MFQANQAPQVPAGGNASPFANAGKDRKSKMPILPTEEVERQYRAKLEAERMSDEEFADLWRSLRADAVAAEKVAQAPYDLKRASEKSVADQEGVEPVEVDPLDPDFEYMTDDGKTIDGIDAIRAREMEKAALEAELAAQKPEDELSFDEKVEKCKTCVLRTNRFREILRKTLVFCIERKQLHAVEEEIQTYPEYEAAAQNPYRLIRFLTENYGLDMLEMDEEGEVVTPERKVGLTEDEIDDLIVEFQLETTDVGKEVARQLEPKSRIASLLREFPVRLNSYRNVMSFCKEPKTMKEINALFENVDLKALGTMHSDDTIAIQPSVFVDKLEKAGAMYWDGKWKLTVEGLAFLNGMDKFVL